MKNKKWIFLLIPVVILLGLVLFPGSTSKVESTSAKTITVDAPLVEEEINADEKLTIERLTEVVKQFKPKYPEIIIAQAIEESGHFKSNLFIKHGNLFGMKQSGSRPTAACYITKSGYAGYCGDKVLMSVTDRILLDAAFYRGLSKDQYFGRLAKTYASNPSYVPNLKKIIKQYNLL